MGGGPEVPPGDPEGIRGAAAQLHVVAGRVSDASGSCSSVISTALDGWSSPSAQVFSDTGSRYRQDIHTLVDGLDAAASALRTYAAELQSAPDAARGAIAARQNAQDDAAAAEVRVGSTVPPPASAGAAAAQSFAADQARSLQGVQNRLAAATAAADARLASAQLAASEAASKCAAALARATGELHSLARQPPSGRVAHAVDSKEKAGWVKVFDGWFTNVGHMNDLLGGMAVAVVHDYEKSADAAGKAASQIFESLPSDQAEMQAILNGGTPLAGIEEYAQTLDKAMTEAGVLENPVVKLLTKGLVSEDAGFLGQTLGKVPIVGALFALGDIGFRLADGKSIVSSVATPTANLAVGVVSTELVSAALASTAVPVVGEVVIAGAVSVVAATLADKGASWVWAHRGQIEHAVASVAHDYAQLQMDVVNYGVDAARTIVHIDTQILNGIGDGIGTGIHLAGEGLDAAASFGVKAASGIVHGVESLPGVLGDL